ncbi:MAG: hypothetical protein WC792_03105 [Candidatus Micrarchaeia archaeon]|jgi:hypothetical protein
MLKPDEKGNGILATLERLARDNWHILLFALISISLPPTWLYSEDLYVIEEMAFANYDIFLDSNSYAWSSSINYGGPSTLGNMAALIPNAAFYRLLDSAGFSNHQIQIIFLQTFLLLIFFSINKFLRMFTAEKWIIVACALLYVLNFHFVSAIFYSAKMTHLILMPLLFVFSYRLLQTGKRKYVAYSFISLFLLQSIFANWAQAIPALAMIFLAIGHYVFETGESLKTVINTRLKEFALLALCVLPVMAYSLLIIWVQYTSNGIDLSPQGLNLSFKALTAPLNQVFQLRGAWWEYLGWEGVPYSPWLWFYTQWTTIAASFGLVIIALSAGFSKTKNKKFAFFLLFFVAAVFLATGSSFFPLLFELIFKFVPGFFIFREPWAKFMPYVVLSVSALLAISLERLKKQKIYPWVITIIFILLAAKAAPFVSQAFFSHTNAGWAKFFINPPNPWYDYEDWSKQNRDKYVLPLPYGDTDIRYTWYDGNLGNANKPIYPYFGHTNIIGEKFTKNRFSQVLDAFEKVNRTDFVKLGPVDYLLVQKDINQSVSEQRLVHQSKVKTYFQPTPEKTFDNKLYLYRVNPGIGTPVIFVPEKIIALENGTIADLPKIVSKSAYQPLTAIYLGDTPARPASLSTPKEIGMGLDYRKINPTQYRVSLSNARGAFPIILAESFQPNWKAYATKPTADDAKTADRLFEILFEPALPEETHAIANGYANSWFIDSEKICKNSAKCKQNSNGTYDFDLVLEFWPQRFFYANLAILGIIFGGCVTYLFYDWLREKRIMSANARSDVRGK